MLVEQITYLPMPEMTDPSAALASFQRDLSGGLLPLQRGMLDPNLSVLFDRPGGRPRYIYLSIEQRLIAGLVILAMVDVVAGEPCFQLGVAVPRDYRGQGRAKKIVKAALAELRHGFAKNNLSAIHVEAVVSVDNIPSQRVVAACLLADPLAITDRVSGLPALHYTTRYELSSQKMPS